MYMNFDKKDSIQLREPWTALRKKKADIEYDN